MFDSAAEDAFVTDERYGSNLPDFLAPHVRVVSSIAEMKHLLFDFPHG